MKLKIKYNNADGTHYVSTYDTDNNTFQSEDGSTGSFVLNGQTVSVKGPQPVDVTFDSWPEPKPGVKMNYTSNQGWSGVAEIVSVS